MGIDRPLRMLEDLQVGETRRSGTFTVSEQDIIDFAQKYDPQWFHTDPVAARGSHFGQIVASGVHVLAIWRQLDHQINNDIDFVCGIGFDDFRLKTALRPDDEVYVTSCILSIERSKSGKQRGTVVGHYEMRNQRDEIVLHFNSINLVHARDALAAGT